MLDKSSSMVRTCIDGNKGIDIKKGEVCPSGQTKWEVARQAVSQVVNGYQDVAEFGLMIFPKPNKCSPGEVVVVPELSAASKIIANLGEAPTYGGAYTPMADTLKAVANLDWMKGEKRHVVLVTDGSECCYAPGIKGCIPGMSETPIGPVETLRALGVTTHIVGFSAGVDSNVLDKMAKAGGASVCGKTAAGHCYHQTDSLADLTNALDAIARKVSDEICNGVDDNCDTKVDLDDPKLKVPVSNLCDNQKGVCKGATKVCLGQPGWQCTPETLKAAIPEYHVEEICDDGLDNNCNGKTDEGCGDCTPGQQAPCGETDEGECTMGTWVCDAQGNWPKECPDAVMPSPELWDGKDNDCDGDTDEDFDCKYGADPKPCGSDVGECTAGTMTCSDGKWTSCSAQIGKVPESCDGKDNNCNGVADDGLEPRACALQVGVCYESIGACGGDRGWKACGAAEYQATAQKFGAVYQKEETACDNFDNDCDGTIDENCPCSDGQKQDCAPSPGLCEVGTKLCVNGVWGECKGTINGIEEVCDNRDNNCDGQVDEGLTQTCSNACGTGTMKCIRGQWLDCDAREPSEEKCDGIDNDCDGTVDGIHVSCPNNGQCIAGKCTDQHKRMDLGMMAGGGISCAAGGSGAGGAGLLLLSLLSLLILRRRR